MCLAHLRQRSHWRRPPNWVGVHTVGIFRATTGAQFELEARLGNITR